MTLTRYHANDVGAPEAAAPATPPADPGRLAALRAEIDRGADAPAVARLRRAVYELRARAVDAAGAPAIDYSRERVQSSPKPETFEFALSGAGASHTRDPVGERLARLEARGPSAALALAVLVWLRGTAGFEYPAHAVRRRAYDVRKLLDAARDPADLRPLRLALAESWVAERFVPPARWKKWAASESVDGELAWATEATEAAVAAWESTA